MGVVKYLSEMTPLIYLLILSTVISLVIMEDIKDMDLNQLVKLGKDVTRFNPGDVKDGEVTFLLFTKSSEEAVQLTNETNIDLNKLTKVIIHGWIANSRRPWYKDMTDEFLKNGDFNVIHVDWEKPARTFYFSSAANSKLIGEKIAAFIDEINISPENLHLVGHSLGAHVAGFAAKKIYEKTGTKVSRISGLDPAGPYFQEYIFNKDERLDKDDADVVDIIHTDAGVYGISFPLGSLDIYVNKGTAIQPGCSSNFNTFSAGELLENSFCSHSISITYFIEWINNGKFRCRLCRSRTFFVLNICPKKMDLREEEVNANVTGICITNTHQVKPFLYQ